MLLDSGANPKATNSEGLSAFTLAMRNGLPEVARLLDAAGAGETMTEEERFMAACAAADRAEAVRIQTIRPDLPAALSESQLRQLPQLTESRCDDAVRLMVE